MMPRRVAETDPQTADHRRHRLRPLHLQAGRMEDRREGGLRQEPELQAAQRAALGLAGGKVAKVDRIEWIWIPDPQTQVNALLNGEVDLLELMPSDLLPLVENVDQDVRTTVIDRPGRQYIMRFNVLAKPFDNPRVRQAVVDRARARSRSSRPMSAIRASTRNASRCSRAACRSRPPRAGRTG